MVSRHKPVERGGEFRLVGDLAFRNVEVDAAAVLADGAAGDGKRYGGAEQVHERVGAHVAIAVGPVEAEGYSCAYPGQCLALGGNVDDVLGLVIHGCGDG